MNSEYTFPIYTHFVHLTSFSGIMLMETHTFKQQNHK